MHFGTLARQACAGQLGPVRNPHLLSPQALLHTFTTVGEGPAPRAWILAIRGERFELGEPMTAAATRNLEAAVAAFFLVRTPAQFPNLVRELFWE